MKLLILTQAVDENNPVLGFFLDWIKEFAKHCENVVVLCLYKGQYNLPGNVKVLSLGKEEGVSRIKYLYRFYKYIWQERKNYDAVFVHMNQIYVILGGCLWRAWKKKVGLWYVHKQVSWQLKVAARLADIIFTTSRDSFGLDSSKVKILGHGVNINKFHPTNERLNNTGCYNIIYVGRISKIKNQKLLIEAFNFLVNERKINNIRLKLIGDAISSKDMDYKKELAELVGFYKLADFIEFSGSVKNDEIINFYHQADLSINLCPTGGVDKAVLESMATGLPVIVLNNTFKDDFGIYCEDLMLANASARELAEKIINIRNMDGEKLNQLKRALINRVNTSHSLEALVKVLCQELKYGK